MSEKQDQVIDYNKTIFTKEDSYIATDNEIYLIGKLSPDWAEEMTYDELDEQTAYVLDGFFYTAKGDFGEANTAHNPGLYKGEDNKIVLVEVNQDNSEEVEMYSISNYLFDTSKENLVVVLKNDENYMNIPDCGNGCSLELKSNDDILKRAIKEALITKNIDIDLQKDRFLNKNQLLNFKQVVFKGDKPLSMLLFQRGIEVLGLKFTIIVEECGGSSGVIGKPLSSPIVVSSEDTYDGVDLQ